MVSFQLVRDGARALMGTGLGESAVSRLEGATTAARELFNEAYPSCRGLFSKATELFKSPPTAYHSDWKPTGRSS